MEDGVFARENPSERAGWAVSISGDGNVIAMGIPKGGAVGGGSAVAYKYIDFSFSWNQFGKAIQGSTVGEGEGYSVSLSDNGPTMIVGTPRAANMVGFINAGKATVYYTPTIGYYNEEEWQALGQDIYGE